MPDAGFENNPLANEVVRHVQALLFSAGVPPLPPELEPMRGLHEYLLELRRTVGRFAKGDFSQDTRLRGMVAGGLKALQANLLHLAWQIEQVAKGDFTQRVDFLGDFSVSFNSMVRQLAAALESLQRKEKELTDLTRSLEHEVEQRGHALKALQESESHLRYLAEHDALTDILNRRSFFSLAEMHLRRAALLGVPCCGALLDIDHFKKFNDTYGHPNGDLALKHVVRVAESSLRQSDIIGRYGGEEFAFFFNKADARQGEMAAERIRRSVEANPVQLPDRAVPVTVSMGVVAILPEHTKRFDKDLIRVSLHQVDAALYRAKAEGRNRVCLGEMPPFDEEPPPTV